MNKTLKICCTAMLTALSVVANIFTIPLVNNVAISFTVVFCFVAGIYLGIVPAVVVGFVGDLIAHFIHPFGAYNWFIALSSLLFGLICALVYRIKCPRLAKLAIAAVICYVVCTCFLNTFGLWLQYVVGVSPDLIGVWQFFTMDKGGIKKSFWLYLAGRAPWQTINLAVNVVIIGVLQQTKALDKMFVKLNDSVNNKQKKHEEKLQKVANSVAAHNEDKDPDEATTSDVFQQTSDK